MIKWYTADDLTDGYSLSEWGIKYWVKAGKLEYMRIPSYFGEAPERWTYLIPDLELHKLAKYKTGEPQYQARHQPDYIILSYQPQEMRIYIPSDERFLKPSYYEYMTSGQWRRVRQEALARDGYQCRICGTAKNLCVHHVSYKSLGTAQELDDLITVCDECHSKIHRHDLTRQEAEHDSD